MGFREDDFLPNVHRNVSSIGLASLVLLFRIVRQLGLLHWKARRKHLPYGTQSRPKLAGGAFESAVQKELRHDYTDRYWQPGIGYLYSHTANDCILESSGLIRATIALICDLRDGHFV